MADARNHGFKLGDIINLDPNAIPDLVIITAEEAKAIAEKAYPLRQFIVTDGKKK